MPGEGLVRFLATSADASVGEQKVLPNERRTEPRLPTNWIAMVRLDDGIEIPCTVKDVSKSGARLGLPEGITLPESFRLMVLGYAFLFEVRLVWRSGHSAGVRIERVGRQPMPAAEPEELASSDEGRETYAALGRRRSRYFSFRSAPCRDRGER